MISYELRTPLHAIVLSVELLSLNLRAEGDRKIIERLEAGARHLEAQMRDLTDYAWLGAGKLKLRMAVFDPAELLDSGVDANTPAAHTKGLALRGDFVGERGPIESDPHRVRQIVTNLVTNAIKYTDTGSVDVHFLRTGKRLDISVDRHRTGNCARAVSADFPGIHATGFVEYTALRRCGHGARGRARAGRSAGRHHRGVERSGTRRGISREPAGGGGGTRALARTRKRCLRRACPSRACW